MCLDVFLMGLEAEERVCLIKNYSWEQPTSYTLLSCDVSALGIANFKQQVIDRNRNIIWRTLIPSTTESPAEACRFWNILKLKDNMSYITMGMDFKYEPRYFGWLAKFTDDGQLIWTRKYNVEDRKSIGYEIRDLAEDTNGNLIAVGERQAVK